MEQLWVVVPPFTPMHPTVKSFLTASRIWRDSIAGYEILVSLSADDRGEFFLTVAERIQIDDRWSEENRSQMKLMGHCRPQLPRIGEKPWPARLEIGAIR
jgi:hypothetical protein